MLEVIEKLLILQDRDRKIVRTRTELANVEPQRRMLQGKIAGAQANLESAKLRVKQGESERKRLELEVEAKKQLIEKYSLQQFQTKKNEEYRALTHEIDMCKEAISKLEDQQLEFMEQIDKGQKDTQAATQQANEIKKGIDAQMAQLAEREKNLAKEFAELETNRDQLAAVVDERVLVRYQRLIKQKGENVIVGVEHGVCGGCHMKLPVQIIVTCQGEHELVGCPNCGRILYYTRDMDLAVAE